MPVHLEMILDLLTDRETEAAQKANQIRAQITALTTNLARIDSELADLATTRATLQTSRDRVHCREPRRDQLRLPADPHRPTHHTRRRARQRHLPRPRHSNRSRNTSKAPAPSSNAWLTEES